MCARFVKELWESVHVIGGQLELAELSSDESAMIATLSSVGRVYCPPAARIRANLIEQIVTRSGPIGTAFVEFRRIAIHNALVDGKVDLADCTSRPVLFVSCYFTDPDESFDISRSQVKDLRFSECVFAGRFRGENSKVEGNFLMKDSVLLGSINLMLATIGGSFIVDGCHLDGADEVGLSLTLDGLHVAGIFQISNNRLAGGLGIREARLASQSSVRDTHLGAVDSALGTLFLQKTRFESEMTIGPRVALCRLMGEALKSESDLVLTRVQSNSHGLDVNLDRLNLKGGLQIFDVWGEGDFLLRGATIGLLKITKSRFLAPGLSGVGPRASEPEDRQYALAADGIVVASDVQLGPDFLAIGEVRLIDAVVGGQVQYTRGAVTQAVRLNLEGVKVGSTVFLDDMDRRSIVHLAAAKVGGIFFDPGAIPHVSLLRAEYRFINDVFGRPPSLAASLELLSRDHMGHSVVPYGRLAKWFSDVQSDDRTARAILIAGERASAIGRSLLYRAVDALWRLTAGYGYAPTRALVPFVGLVALATILFALLSGYTEPAGWMDGPAVVPFGAAQTVFNPFLYALAATVPFLPDFLAPWSPANPVVQGLTVVFQVLGWFLLTSLVAGIANRIRRRN